MEEYEKGVIEKALKRTFSPEFLNRIDDIIIFNSLSKENILKIIDIVLKGVYKRLEHLGYTINISASAKEFLSEKGYDPQFGARPLHRAIQKHLEDPLAEEILNNKVKEGETLNVDYDEKEGKLKFSIKKSRKSSSEKSETP
jgi:ATP-dependent Clp protease ATP-binding subunit ClpC